MFVLKNKYGNIVKTVETECEKERLESLGYEVVAATKEKGIDLSECKNKADKLNKIKNSIGK